ncbi:hypothetical protein [Mycobacterium sp. URHB0021]
MLDIQRTIGATEIVGTAPIQAPFDGAAVYPRLYHHLVATLFLAVAALAAAWLFLFT